MDPESRAYRRVVTNWLRRRHFPAKDIRRVHLRQVVQADINHDGRQDLLFSFDWIHDGVCPDSAKGEDYTAYVFVHYRPRGAKAARTLMVADHEEGPIEVRGLCDLNRDGWAEIVVDSYRPEYWGSRLYYWSRSKFAFVDGDVTEPWSDSQRPFWPGVG